MVDYGTRCSCGRDLIAPDWSECVSGGSVRHLWHCRHCGSSFETMVRFDANPIPQRELVERFLPTLVIEA